MPIRSRKNSLSLGKPGHFAHPFPEKQSFVGQNRAFCPSAAGNTALRWAKPGILPIRSRKISPSLGKTGQQPGARRAFSRAPRSARAVAAGSRSLRRRCPAPAYPCLPPPSTTFAPPNPQNPPYVPQNQSFWCPAPAKTARCAPKTAILVSRTSEKSPLCSTDSHFGVRNPAVRAPTRALLPRMRADEGVKGRNARTFA